MKLHIFNTEGLILLMNIIIDENSNLNQGSSGLITGEIYFEQNNYYFPEKRWSDFPVIVLGWWISSFLEFVKQNSGTFEFCFMDGPFKIVGVVIQEEMIEIYSCSQYEDVNKKDFLGYMNKNEIQNMLLKASRKLFKVIALSDISDNKLDGLKKLFFQLKELEL